MAHWGHSWKAKPQGALPGMETSVLGRERETSLKPGGEMTEARKPVTNTEWTVCFQDFRKTSLAAGRLLTVWRRMLSLGLRLPLAFRL